MVYYCAISIDIKLRFIQGSKLGVLTRLVAIDDVDNLRAQIDHYQWTEAELNQVNSA